jgi:hypothetical protein
MERRDFVTKSLTTVAIAAMPILTIADEEPNKFDLIANELAEDIAEALDSVRELGYDHPSVEKYFSEYVKYILTQAFDGLSLEERTLTFDKVKVLFQTKYTMPTRIFNQIELVFKDF